MCLIRQIMSFMALNLGKIFLYLFLGFVYLLDVLFTISK